MTTTTSPDVRLHPGASAPPDSWADWNNEFRVIHTDGRRVSGCGCMVYGSALQFPDGHVDDGTLDPNDPPGICIDFDSSTNLTTDQARELAALIVSTADELDGWTRR
jgi:hypothetical protein